MKSQLEAATANPKVATARNSPRTRRAGSPMARATSTPAAVPMSKPTPQGRFTDQSATSKGKGMSWPAVTAAKVNPPSPTKANCASDSCPPQPVSIVSDRAQMANATTLVHKNIVELASATTGTRARVPKMSTNPIWGRWRTTQMC